MSKPTLDVRIPLDTLVDEAEKYIAQEPTIFHKSGELVQVVQEKNNQVLIRPLRVPLTRYMLSRVANWIKSSDKEDEPDKEIHPPSHVASCLVEKTSWEFVRPIRAVTTFPPLSSTGELVTTKGYDPNTNVFFSSDVRCEVPEKPTHKQAKEAAKLLLDIVCDFPFTGPEHKSAWLAALLSPLCRFCHDGNTPIVVIQANGPRVGKTNLAKIISHIIMGAECPVIVHTKNQDEERKRILSYLRAARTMVLVDNVVGQFGGAGINAMVTSRAFEDRILGASRVIQTANDTVWFITGNNVTLAPDTAERCLHVRLMSDEEHPHLRTNFTHTDLFGMVRRRRVEYLSAALTILKAYIVAGMPDQKLPAWGSFEEWSRLVRNALVWVGQADPAITREELELEADVDRQAACMLVDGWLELQTMAGEPNGLTARDAYNLLSNGSESYAPKLRTALAEIAASTHTRKVLNAHTIGRHLREVRDRNFGGHVLMCCPNPLGHRWFVVPVGSSEHKQSVASKAARTTGHKDRMPASQKNGANSGAAHTEFLEEDQQVR